MLTTTLFHWCQARVLARDVGGDTSIPSSFACPLPIAPTVGRWIVVQLLDSNDIATTVRFDDGISQLEAAVQEWTDEEEIE